MRVRLFERLGRLVGWRFGSQGRGDDSLGDSRTGVAEAGGRHRRNPGAGQQRARPADASGAWWDGGPPLQPTAGLPARADGTANGVGAPASGAGQREVTRPPLPGSYTSARGGGGIGRARIREAPFGAAPMAASLRDREAASPPAAATPRQPWYQVVSGPPARRTQSLARAAGRNGAATTAAQRATGQHGGPAAAKLGLPYAAAHPHGHPVTADGRRNCGPLEEILWRQWDAATTVPPPQAIAAIDRLAEFPRVLQEKLAAGLDAIYVGAGGVPDLDDMAALHGVALPSGKATWDACAGAYGERKIVVGTRPSPTPDVVCHEVGHALDDLDSPPGKWQSDLAEFRLIYDQCQPYIASDFHRQRGGLGRKEFFADSFASIASAQRPALVDMLSGNTRIALRVMLYFNRRYGI